MSYGERQAFIVSPHQDDAVLSAGVLLSEYDAVDVANLFTQSNSHILPDVGENIEEVSKIRQQEDQRIADMYGFRFHDAGFADSEVRGVRWDDHWAPVDEGLVRDAEQFLYDRLPSGDIDVYIPGGFGMHPDHLIAQTACIRAIGRLGVKSWFLYADQPYYSSPNSVRLQLHDSLSHESRISIPFSYDQKKIMLDQYPSQLSPERVDKVAAIGKEYIWRGTTDMIEQFDPYSRYKQSSTLFGSKAWHDASRLHTPAVAHSVLGVRSSNGDKITLPLMTSTFQIADRNISALRFEGAGWFDYANFDGAEYFDSSAWSEFMSQARQSGADVLWLSGIREDSSLYRVLESDDAQPGHLFAGAPSLILDCHKNGFDAWYTNSNSQVKKKVRHTENKNIKFTAMGGSVSIRQASTKDVGTFLDLQRNRADASGGALDAFQEDPHYCALLYELADKGEISVAAMEMGTTPVGMMLFHYEPHADGALSIINQGFDPQFGDYAPGFIMQLALIKHAYNTGARIVDYLKGAEPYKRQFANRELKLYKYMQPLRIMHDADWKSLKEFGESYVE